MSFLLHATLPAKIAYAERDIRDRWQVCGLEARPGSRGEWIPVRDLREARAEMIRRVDAACRVDWPNLFHEFGGPDYMFMDLFRSGSSRIATKTRRSQANHIVMYEGDRDFVLSLLHGGFQAKITSSTEVSWVTDDTLAGKFLLTYTRTDGQYYDGGAFYIKDKKQSYLFLVETENDVRSWTKNFCVVDYKARIDNHLDTYS